jgi:hypothetical protein
MEFRETLVSAPQCVYPKFIKRSNKIIRIITERQTSQGLNKMLYCGPVHTAYKEADKRRGAVHRAYYFGPDICRDGTVVKAQIFV